MKEGAVAVYDLSGRSGYAVYAPYLEQPVFGYVPMPKTHTNGSVGSAGRLLFDHIAWLNRQYPLSAIGYEAFIAATGTSKDDDKGFKTSPAAQKRLIGLIVVLETCADILGITDHVHSINNSSWKRYWLGSHRRGTKRETWKELSVDKAHSLGWDVKVDDEADALGQLHFLLAKLEIKPSWARTPPTRALIDLGMKRGVPVHV